MRKFYFSLEKILSLRSFYEKQAEAVLQKAVAERDAVKIEIEGIDAKILETSAFFSKDVDMNILLWAESYVKGLKMKKVQLEVVLLKLEEKVQDCLEKYHEALKKRKILDRVKDKRLEEWKERREREEIFVLDETVSAKINLNA